MVKIRELAYRSGLGLVRSQHRKGCCSRRYPTRRPDTRTPRYPSRPPVLGTAGTRIGLHKVLCSDDAVLPRLILYVPYKKSSSYYRTIRAGKASPIIKRLIYEITPCKPRQTSATRTIHLTYLRSFKSHVLLCLHTLTQVRSILTWISRRAMSRERPPWLPVVRLATSGHRHRR